LTLHTAKKPWVAEFVLLGALWGGSFLFMRLANQELGALPTVGVRVAIASAFLACVLLIRGLGAQLRQYWKRLLFVGVINSGLPFACFSFALLSISTGLSAILNATAPMFGAMVAWVWLGDRPDRSRLLGLVIGFLGITLLAWDKASFRPDASGLASGWAVLACLLACLCYGLSASYTKRHLAGVPSLVAATGSQLGATLALAAPTYWLWPAHAPSSRAWLALLAVGILCTGLAYILYFRLIERVGPAKAMTVTFLVPVFALLYGSLFLQETLTLHMLLCGAVVVLGTSLSTGLLRLPLSAR
jgi:drug/metabolite transporter (DMT)-like permease